MQHDRIAGGFDPQHRLGQQIAGDAGDDVLGPQAAIGALPWRQSLNWPAALSANTTTWLRSSSISMCGLRIGDLAAARQLQLQERADALEGDAAAANDPAALAHRSPGGTIDVVPERLIFGCAARHSVLNVSTSCVGEFIRLEFPPGIQAAHVSERQIAGLADAALRRVLRVGTRRHAEDLAGGLAVRLVARIACRVKAAVGVELPLFAGNPRQHAAFDRC